MQRGGLLRAHKRGAETDFRHRANCNQSPGTAVDPGRKQGICANARACAVLWKLRKRGFGVWWEAVVVVGWPICWPFPLLLKGKGCFLYSSHPLANTASVFLIKNLG